MGVDEGNLQVIDIEVITKKIPMVLLYGTYVPAVLMVFIIHTIPYICDSMMSKRYRKGVGSGTYYMGFVGVRISTKGREMFCLIGLKGTGIY